MFQLVITFYNPTSKEELKHAIQFAWDSIKMETINKLCESFLRRCYLCLKQKGECIQHLLHSEITHNVTDEEFDEVLQYLQNENVHYERIEIILPKIE